MKKSLCIALLIISCSFSICGQTLSSAEIPKDEINKLVRTYRQSTPHAFIQQWIREMPPPIIKNVAFRKQILTSLPPGILKLRVQNRDLENAVAQVLGPVLALYNRSGIYEIIIVNHPSPLVMSDSGVALVITTGMLQRTTSDDMLLGIVAHEIGHEYYTQRTHDLRQQYQLLLANTDSGFLLKQVLVKLAEIELQCDAFSAITLAAIGRNPTYFGEHLIAISNEFKGRLSADDHPPAKLRASFITSIVPKEVLQIQPQNTKQLQSVKLLLALVRLT